MNNPNTGDRHHDTPPLFSSGRAGLSRFPARTLLLVLALLAGTFCPAQRAFAQGGTPGVTLGGTTVTNGSHALSVNENSTASYSIKLNAVPTGNVIIRPRAGASSSITLETASLTFDTTNWNVAQSVTVRAANDSNRVDESVEITHTISGGGYGSVAVPGVTVTASDDDKSSNNELLFLSLQSVTLSPAFSRTRTSYTANVANSVSRVTVSARARDRTATVSITPADADAVASGHQVTLGTASVNNIRVRVTAENGDVRDYTVAVTRAKSTTPSSFSFTDRTGVEPGTEVTSDQITVSVETGSPAISVSSGGTLVVDGTDFTGNSVTNGQKVAVKVTASSSFSTKKSVTVTIGGVSDEFSVTTRAASGNANLSSIGLSSGTLDPAVSADRTTYTVRVGSSVNKIKVTPNTANSAARVKVNRGSYAASGTQSPYIYFPFRGSLSRFAIVVTVRAEDGTEKRYTLRVSRQSNDAFLSGLIVSAGGSELVLARSSGGSTVAGFDRRTTAYTVRVPQTTTSVEVTPTTSEPRATVRCCIGAGGQVTRDANGRLVATTVSVQSSTSTVLSVVVTPEDSGAPQRTYTVTVEKTSKRVSVDPVSLTVGEGRTATYTVSLAGAPTGPVTVTPSSGNTAVATVSRALTFTTSTWSTPQTVTVTGVDNRQADAVSGRRTTVTHTVSGGGYDGAAAATVGVKVTDVPAASISSTNPSSLREDNLDGATVTVTLSGAIYVATGLDEDDFELASAPSGTTVSAAVRNSATAATLTLAYDDTDFDAAAKLGVRVLATGHSGSEALATGEVDVAAVAETRPAAPTGLTAAARNLSAALSWTDPSDAAITGYEYRRKLTSASSYGPWTPMTGSGAATTSYTVGGLSNGLAYDFQIRAVNSRAPTETSAASATATATPAAATAPVTSNREWHTPDTGWAVHYDGWAVRTTSLAASATRQRVDFTFFPTNVNARYQASTYRYTVLGCPFTTAVISAYETRPRGCETVAGSPINANAHHFGYFSGNLTPTRAMIANGGVVFVMWYASGSLVEAVYAKWVPLEGGAAITKTNPTALGEGNLNGATVTVDLTGSTFNAGVGVGDFELTGVPAGATVAVSSVVRGVTDTDMATLTLSFRGNFNADFSLGVTAKASGHTGTQDLTAGTVRVAAVVEPPTLSGLEILGVRGTLSRGVVSESRSALSPSPAFSGETTSYAVTVPATMEHVRIVPTAREPWNVTITVDGTAYGSGNLTGRIKLAAVGTGKTINVVVTPKDPGLSASAYTYVVTVTREAATITPSVTTLDARVGTAITDVTFTAGGAGFSPTGWSVDPALPQGLSMDSGTGTISGTPQSAAEATDYTVTGIGESSLTVRGFQRRHQASATVRITVNTGTDDAGVEFSSGTAVAADTGKRGLTVNEGSTADYTIALTEEPSGTVTVRPVVRGSTDVTISPFWLEFTTQNYDTAQSFTVRAGSDGDAVDDVAVISHTASGGGYDGTLIESVTVTVDDDEEVGLKITRTAETDGSHALTVTEGSTNTYDVALGSEPGSSVTVTPVLAPGTDVTVTPGSLEFDSTNWETAKSFTVSAGEDDDATDDAVKIRHSMSSVGDSYYNGKSGPVVTVTVDDNDDFGVTLGITPGADGTYGLSVNEDGTASYTIKLDAEPTGDVTIRPTAGESASVSVETKFLSFTVNDWNVAQSVTVKGLADGNAADESVEITHSISGGGYGSVTVPAVTVTAVDDDRSSDNDLKALAISSVTLSPAFNRAVTTYTASVANSVSRVTVAAVASNGAAEISITPADADANTGGHQVDLDTANVNNITISVTAQTGGVKNYAVAVTRAKSVTPAGFSFTDVTGAEPGAEVTSDAIEVDVEDTGAAIPISVTSGGTLVVDGVDFTGNTVRDEQRVAVKVRASSEFSAAKSATVTIGGVSDEFSVTTRAAGGNADLSSIGLSSGTLDPAVSAERTTYTVRVGSGVNRIKVTPNTADARARVKVNRGSYAASGTESPYINFPFGRGLSRFGILVTVRAEDGTEKKYTLRVSRQSNDAYLSGLVVAAGGGELALGRSSGGSTVAGFSRTERAYTVRVPPAATSVEVRPTTSDPRATVTVAGNAVTRDGNGRLPAATVNLQSGSSTAVSIVVTPEDAGAPKQTYTVTVEKTERRVVVSPVSLVVGEGSTATYTVSLAGAPTGPVTVTPASGNTGAATVSGALAFTTQNWRTPQTVTVTGVDNRLDDPPSGRGTTVTHTVSGGGYGGAAAATVRVKVTDEAASIAFTNPVSLTEDNLNGAVVTVDVSGGLNFSSGADKDDFELTGVPRGIRVSISEATRDGSNRSRAELTLSYNGADFDSDFSLGVTAKAGGHTGTRDLATETVRVSAVVEPPTLSGLEVLGVRGTLSRGVVSESRSALAASPAFSGETTNYSVTVPATMEHVRIVPTAREPWNVTITVDGTAWGSGNLTGRIKLAAVGTGKRINVVVTPRDPGLSATAYTYVVTVTREAAAITPSATTLNATAGTAVTAVTFTSGGEGFGPTSWSVDPELPQGLSMDSGTGRISGTPRSASASADYTVTATGESSLTALGVERVHQASATVRITVEPEVTGAGATISTTSLTVNEGSTAVYTIALSAQPTGTVTVRLSASGSGDVSIDTSSLEFTQSNWNQTQTVTVTAGEDGDVADDAAVISHTASGGGYDGVAIDDVAVTVNDDDSYGATLGGTTVTNGSHGLSVNEDSTATYTIKLDAEPTGDVTIRPTAGQGSSISVETSFLRFTPRNWNVAKEVKVKAAADANAVDESVLITHAIEGGGYGSVSVPDITVTADDDDGSFGVTVEGTTVTNGSHGLSVNEDSTASYSIKLDAEPTGDVTIRPRAGGSSSISVETSFLRFTADNWSAAQSVKVKAAADGNASDESVLITHAIEGGGYGSVAVPAVAVTAVDDDRSSDNDLRGMRITSVTLDPAFSADRTTYAANVPNSVSRVTVVAAANDGTAEVSITPADADAGTRGHQVDLGTAAVNTITVRVTAQDGARKDYTVAVTRAKSVTPASFAFTDVTEAEPGAEVTSSPAITVSGIEADSAPISVTSGGTLVVDGSVFTGNSVSNGQTVAVRLRASSEFSTETSATVSIGGVSDEFSVTTRAASGNADLSGIGLSSGTLDPAVSAGRTEYTVRVGSGVDSIKVTPATAHSGARVKVNRGSYAAGGTESGDILFPPERGLSRFGIVITVRAEDGTEKRYELRVARESRDAYLSGLAVEAGGSELALGRSSGASTVAGFSRTATAYTVRVPTATTTVEITPTTSEPRATVTVNGVAATRDANGRLTATTVSVSTSPATVSVVVTPEDSSAATRTYTVTVEKTTRRVIVDPVSLTVGEGSSATYTVRLEGQPTGTVTVTPVSGNTGAATVTGALSFTTGNWNTPQTVTVSGVDDLKDNPASGRRTAVTHTVTGGGYDGAAAASVNVRVTDEAALIQSTNPVSLTEENLNGATITVDLAGGLDFRSAAAAGDFELSGVPAGISVSVQSASRDGSDDSRAELTLSYDNMDFDSDFSMRVTAKSSGHTGSSDLVTSPVSVTATDETPAARPTGLSARGAPQSAVLTWTDPTDALITGYQVSRKLSSASSWGAWTAVSGSDSSTVTHTVTSLTNGTRYDFRIRALRAKTDPSPASATASAAPEAEGASIQSTSPASLSEANLNGATVTVDLEGGLDFNMGVDKDDFSLSGLPSGVTVSVSAASRDATSHYRAALTLSYDAANAANDFDSAFNLAVTAEAAGHTGSSNLSTGTVEVTATAETAAVKPANLRAAVGNAQVVLTWDNPSNASITGYQVSRKLSTAQSWDAWATISGSGASTTTYTVTSLTNGTAYDFRIRALVFKAPASPASDTASATPSLQSASIQSTAPTSLSEANLNGATVTVDLAGGLNFSSGADKDDFSLSGLPSGTTVSISSAARNATNHARAVLTLSYATDATNDFDSDFNLGVTAKAGGHTGAVDLSTSTVTVTATAEAAAAKPTGLSAREGPRSAALTWTNPSDSTITGYQVSRKLSTAQSWGAWTAISGSGATTTTYTVTSLTNGTAYDFRIRALVFKAPASPASDAASATPAALGASIQSTSPSPLTEANLNGATVTVDLAGGLDFQSGAGTNDFQLTGVPAGITLSISAAARNATNHSRAALTLSHSGNFDVSFNLGVRARASGHTGSSDLVTGTVAVTATRGVTVSATSLTINESGAGNSAKYRVKLDSRPSGQVTITPTGTANVAVTTAASDNKLRFTVQNWNSEQEVTVTAVDDKVDNANNRTATVSHTVTGADYGSVTASDVSVTLTDDDTKSVIISKSSATINESGAGNSFTYTVRLGSMPSGTVTVTVSPPSGIATADAASLSFAATGNTGRWDQAQTVTVTAVDDRVDNANNRSGNVTHTVTGADYQTGVTPGSIAVTLTDDDAAGVTVSQSSLSVTEAGSGVDYTVVLTSRPSANVTVDISSGDADVKVKTGSGTAAASLTLTFTPTGTGIWSTAQTVTVTAADDADTVNETVTLTQSIGTGSASEYSSVNVANVTVNVADDDTPNLDVSRTTALALAEGASSTYNVKLTTQPSSDVVVEISSDNPDVTVKKAGAAAAQSVRLTFTPSGAGIWSTAQTVTVASVADTDSLDDSATITHRVVPEDSDDDYDPVSSKTFTVAVTDSTLAGLAIADASAAESAGTLDFTVTLAMASSRTVTVNWTLTAGNTNPATAGTATTGDYDATTAGGTLTFTSGSSLSQTVSVPINDDPVVEPDETVTVTLSSAVGATISASTATGTIRNDDAAGVRVSPERSQRTTTEDNAGTVDLTVSLSSRPSADVTVTVTSTDTTEGRVKQSEEDDDPALDFTTGTWDTAQTVTVTGVDDDDLDGDVEYNVRFAFSSTDTDYGGLDPVDVALTNLDDDLSILSVSGGGEVAEGDSGTTARATFTVTLSPARRQAVSVGYATSDGTAEAGSDYESASGTVTFSPGETSQTVSVTINGDDEAEANETFTLALTSTPNGQIDPQNSSAQAVITNDDEKMVDAGMSGEFSVGETTVTVESTLPDDTGLEVVLPSELESGGAAIDELTVTLGSTDARIDADLFGYTGNGQDHVLVDIDVSPVPDAAVRVCLPITDGLRRAAGSQRLYIIRFSGGEWEELASETEDDMVCADVRGFSPFAVVFQIDYAKRRVGEVNRAILPELARAMTASTLEAITSRIEDARAGAGTANSLNAQAPPEPEPGHQKPRPRLGEFEDGETLSLTEAVDGSYYSVSLAGGYDAPSAESEAEPPPVPRSGGLGMWISGDYRSISGKGGGLADWNGRLISGHLGADYRFGRSFLAGVATSWSQGSFDYSGRGEGSTRVSGDYASRMNSFHPYLGIFLSERLDLWASAGWGFGEIRMDDGEIPSRQKASARLGTLATGADLALLGGGASSLSLKGEAWISRVKLKGNGDRIEGIRVNANRLRAALQGSRALSLGSGSSLVPSLEFGIRRDGGDGETGVGGELAGGLSLASSFGLTLEARGRALLFHQGDAREWGVGGSVTFDPGGDGRGLSMSVLPSWGDGSSGVQGLWDAETAADLGTSASTRNFGLETEVGYGFPALGDRGLFTPYGAFGRPDPDSTNYRLGSRFSLNRALDLTLEGQRREIRAGDPEHELTVQGRLNW